MELSNVMRRLTVLLNELEMTDIRSGSLQRESNLRQIDKVLSSEITSIKNQGNLNGAVGLLRTAALVISIAALTVSAPAAANNNAAATGALSTSIGSGNAISLTQVTDNAEGVTEQISMARKALNAAKTALSSIPTDKVKFMPETANAIGDMTKIVDSRFQATVTESQVLIRKLEMEQSQKEQELNRIRSSENNRHDVVRAIGNNEKLS